MKTELIISIPVIDKDICFYFGDKGLKTYKTISEEYGADNSDIPDTANGLAYASFIWVDSSTNVNVLFHEAMHVLDNIFMELNIMHEKEFKAYIAGYVFEILHNFLNKERICKK